MEGLYNLRSIPAYFTGIVDQAAPSLLLQDSIGQINEISSANFEYSLDLKRTQPLFDFFFDEIEVDNNTQLHGYYINDSSVNSFHHLESDRIVLGNSVFKDIIVNVVSVDSIINLQSGSKSMLLSNRFEFSNFTFETDLKNDTCYFKNRWANWDSIVYQGNINGKVSLNSFQYLRPELDIQFEDSYVIVNDTLWNLAKHNMVLDSNGIQVNKLKIFHNDQYILVDGRLTDSGADTLSLHVNQFDLAHLNSYNRNKSLSITGNIDGNLFVTGHKKSPVVISNMEAKNVELNKQLVGDVSVFSRWNNNTQSIFIDMFTRRGNLETLSIEGRYYPRNNGEIDLQCNLDKFQLNVVAPYLKNVFGDLQGNALGEATIKGTITKPLVTGNIKLQKTAFSIDYLNTRYSFTNDFVVQNNNILISNLQMYDSYKGTSANVNGNVLISSFKDISMNIAIQTDNLLCLNTSAQHNNSFYGQVYASGLIGIGGNRENIKIKVNATSERNTLFNIPVNEESDVSSYDFITLIDTFNIKLEDKREEQVGEKRTTGLELDFDLNVTPDAEIQIVFDPKIGDIIKARGWGDLKMSMNNAGDFQIIGDYSIEDGDYLFTLQNIINKRFTVKRGSTIQMTGEPLDANIDIDAYYRTKASLYGLF
ncbi:MAG: translocation/assembly module TamB, partial [Bacteroidales bacterium]|nr:translocation/assembly module TamB [Bacteroidales bacterium]